MSEADIKGNMLMIRDILAKPKGGESEEDLKLIALAALTMLECLLIDINKVAEAANFLALEMQRENSA